jgi:hypothetical protein
MKFRNKKKFRHGIPAYTGPCRKLRITYTRNIQATVTHYALVMWGLKLLRNKSTIIDWQHLSAVRLISSDPQQRQESDLCNCHIPILLAIASIAAINTWACSKICKCLTLHKDAASCCLNRAWNNTSHIYATNCYWMRHHTVNLSVL